MDLEDITPKNEREFKLKLTDNELEIILDALLITSANKTVAKSYHRDGYRMVYNELLSLYNQFDI